MSITTKKDDKLIKYMESNAVWIAKLSNGETAYQDDGVYDYDTASWYRLFDYCQENGLYVVDFRIAFRSHTEIICKDSDGVLFGQGVSGGIGGYLKQFYLTGILDGDTLVVKKWVVPELIQVPFIDGRMEQKRDPLQYLESKQLIIRPGHEIHISNNGD